ncbi:MAG TPA: adenylate/guanylate cyclase domain-containing protein [Gemmataceae bacterium]|nr:adenylate/guanylate cyclase domain-containing protein [Gemmataceae bacterium]
MLFDQGRQPETIPPAAPGQCWMRLPLALVYRRPFLCFFLLGVLCNLVGSAFNFVYNKLLIIDVLSAEQRAAFWNWIAPGYNVVAYPLGLGVMLYLLWPLPRCLGDLRAGRSVGPDKLEYCRRRLVNLPFYQVCVNFLAWLPGAVVFPLGIGLLAGWDNAAFIWTHFLVSFLVAALMATVQTFFLLEAFLIRVVYPEFFRDARPADLPGTLRIPLRSRLLLYWVATAVVPVVSLLAVVLTFVEGQPHFDRLRALAVGVAVNSVVYSAIVAGVVGWNLVSWVDAQARATEEIMRGNYDYRIDEKRPDEFGRLTDRFNDMAAGLARARLLRETFGEFVEPDVRDQILEYYQGLGGEVQEITVLFADIRGFTRRSAGEAPDRVFDLLNRFFTLAVAAIREEGGLVNKFLGDGLLALFGVPRARADHADRAVRAAVNLLARLRELNRELAAEGQEPLAVGIGIHTGPALVGCLGAALPGADGRQRFRREYSAIGETVNLAQRVEQLTKTVGGPILLSEQTRARLREPVPLTCRGPQPVPGYDGTLVVHQVEG